MKVHDIIKEAFTSNVQGQIIRASNDLFATRAQIGDRFIIFKAALYTDENGQLIAEAEFTEKSKTEPESMQKLLIECRYPGTS